MFIIKQIKCQNLIPNFKGYKGEYMTDSKEDV